MDDFHQKFLPVAHSNETDFFNLSVLYLPSRVREPEEPALRFQLERPQEWSTKELHRTEWKSSQETRSVLPEHVQ